MFSSNIINLSNLKGSKRIDAERYQYIDLEKKLEKLPNTLYLSELIVKPVRTGHTPIDRDEYPNKTINFVKTDILRKGYIDFLNSDFLPSECLLSSGYLQNKEVLVTIIGAHFDIVGRAAIYLDHFPKSVINQNIVVITVDEKLINPFYLMIFLNSSYGRKQLWMLSRQTEQVNLNCREVEQIQIPLFNFKFQQKIEDLSKNYLAQFEKAVKLRSNAENLLLNELGLENFGKEKKLSYTEDLSKVLKTKRLDAEFFQPHHYDLLKSLKEQVEVVHFGNFVKDYTKGIEVGSENYVKSGKPFIRVSNLSITGYVERDQEYISENLYDSLKTTYEPKLGDFLLTKDATPGIALVVKESMVGILASGILRISIDEKSINKDYLALCINSIIGKSQVEKAGGGSIINHWSPKQIFELEIPIISKSKQEQIISIINSSEELLRESKSNFHKAISIIEEKINQS